MYFIQRLGSHRQSLRLVSQNQLTPQDFHQIARDLGVVPRTARKSGLISARVASVREKIDTHWNGRESSNIASPGDHIVTNMLANREVLLDASGTANTYVVTAERFPQLYELDTGATEFGAIHRPRGKVEALFFSAGFEILAPWGEMQTADAGYILLNLQEVYGNNLETFEKTYSWDA